MCGIGGWISFDGKRPAADSLAELLTRLEARGTDASGITFSKWGDSPGYFKHCVRGSELLKLPEAKKYLADAENSDVVLAHARSSTKGSPDNHRNNHPVFQTDGKYILVHNGVIRNDDSLLDPKGKLKLKREAEVDTEALVALLDKGETKEESVSNLKHAIGTFAIAAMPQEGVDHVIFARRGSPLVLSYDENNDILYFASTMETLGLFYGISEKAVRRGIKQPLMPIPLDIADEQYILFGREGLEGKGRLEQSYDFPVSYRPYGVHSLYGEEEDTPIPLHRRGFASGTIIGGASTGGEALFATGPRNASGEQGYIGKDQKVHVTSCIGFTAKPVEGTMLALRTFPNKVFPRMGVGSKDIAIACPACWHQVSATQMQQRTYHCPKCEVMIDKPVVFRSPSTLEYERGVFCEALGV